MSRRTERVASLIRQIIADAIRTELNDPRIEPLTSITRVEVSPDFSLAKLSVSVYARPPQQKLTIAALRRASGRLRSRLAGELSMRTVPALVFQLDESLQRGFQTQQKLDELMAEMAARTGAPAAADESAVAAEAGPAADAPEPEALDGRGGAASQDLTQEDV